MNSRLIGLLIENACLLLTSKSREVVVSAMSFIKILFSVMDSADLAEHVELMVLFYFSFFNLTDFKNAQMFTVQLFKLIVFSF